MSTKSEAALFFIIILMGMLFVTYLSSCAPSENYNDVIYTTEEINFDDVYVVTLPEGVKRITDYEMDSVIYIRGNYMYVLPLR